MAIRNRPAPPLSHCKPSQDRSNDRAESPGAGTKGLVSLSPASNSKKDPQRHRVQSCFRTKRFHQPRLGSAFSDLAMIAEVWTSSWEADVATAAPESDEAASDGIWLGSTAMVDGIRASLAGGGLGSGRLLLFAGAPSLELLSPSAEAAGCCFGLAPPFGPEGDELAELRADETRRLPRVDVRRRLFAGFASSSSEAASACFGSSLSVTRAGCCCSRSSSAACCSLETSEGRCCLLSSVSFAASDDVAVVSTSLPERRRLLRRRRRLR